MSPILLKIMIDREKILNLVNGKLEENMFLVDVSVNTANVIHVEIDSFTGLTIDQCVAVSRHIEASLDRESEDFELQVSSPGAGQPFKVNEQYRKNQGRELEVTLANGSVLKGLLAEATESGIVIETSVKEKPEGSSRKMLVTKKQQVSFEEIEKARVIISFK
jgi:ribosome maturation factor RimP